MLCLFSFYFWPVLQHQPAAAASKSLTKTSLCMLSTPWRVHLLKVANALHLNSSPSANASDFVAKLPAKLLLRWRTTVPVYLNLLRTLSQVTRAFIVCRGILILLLFRTDFCPFLVLDSNRGCASLAHTHRNSRQCPSLCRPRSENDYSFHMQWSQPTACDGKRSH